MRPHLILSLLVLLLPCAPAASWPALPKEPLEVTLSSEILGKNDTVIYVEDLETGLVYGFSGSRREERHPPFSSFKIPNFLIALETGAVSSIDETIPYRPEKRPQRDYWPADWAQDQTLRTAFRRSAAWAFQDLALKVGEESYRGYLEHFCYGNEACKGDGFWLDRSLEISPKEQVDFLRKLLTEQLEIAPLHVESLRKCALLREGNGFRLFGKTGAGPSEANNFSGPFEGWLVGWLERPNSKPVLYALWTRGESYQAIRRYRQETTLAFLEQLGFLPLAW